MITELRYRVVSCWSHEPIKETRLLKSGVVRTRQTERGFDIEKKPSRIIREYTPTASEWLRFEHKLNASGFWQWDERKFEQIMDGFEWKCRITKDGERKVVGAAYALPGGFNVFSEAMYLIAGGDS